MKRKKFKKQFLAASLALCITTSLLSFSATVNAMEVQENSISTASQGHCMNAGNNYDISKELIMPGEVFRIEPQYEIFHTVGHYGQDVTNCWLYNASLEKGDVQIISNKLVRSTADVSGIEESKTDTYNVFKMAYERGNLNGVLEQYAECEDPELRKELKQKLRDAMSSEVTVTTGYVNNTNTPIVLQQVRTTSSRSEGVLYGGTMDGEKSAIYELNTKSESFFDIGDYFPEREGYTFAAPIIGTVLMLSAAGAMD